jgi:hypothetical protein
MPLAYAPLANMPLAYAPWAKMLAREVPRGRSLLVGCRKARRSLLLVVPDLRRIDTFACL